MKKSMKKFMIACAAVSSIAVAAGMSAMAADISESYNADNNSIPVTVPAAAAEGTQATVLVIPEAAKGSVTDADIYYINQAASNELGGTALLKGESLADGTYLVMVGYYDAEGAFAIAEDSFTIGQPAADTKEILMGDVTGDLKVNSTDAQQILRYAVTGDAKFASDEDKLFAADVTGDGKKNSTDAQQTLRYSVTGESKSNAGKTAVVTADYTVVEYK